MSTTDLRTAPAGAIDLLTFSRAALEELYRSAPAGAIPRGTGRGTAILVPGRGAGRLLARLVSVGAWQGKVFDDDGKHLVNLISPLHRRAIRADVYEGDSWLDNGPCIVIDYSRTSRLARWVHDEIREVAPGVFLGLVYVRRRRLPLLFALNFSN